MSFAGMRRLPLTDRRKLRRRRIAKAIRLFNLGHTNVEIARIMKVSVATVYKYKKTFNID